MGPEWIRLEGGTADGRLLAVRRGKDVVYIPHVQPVALTQRTDSVPPTTTIYRDEYERCSFCTQGQGPAVFHYRRTLN